MFIKNSRGFYWAYIDFLHCLLVGFIAISIISLITLKQIEKDKGDVNVGQIYITMHWDDQRDADMDLWVKSPDDKFVGFLRPQGTNFDLVKDDKGHSASGVFSNNSELAIGRSFIPGEYIIIGMCYKTYDNKFPIYTNFQVIIKHGKTSETIYARTVPFNYEGQVITIIRFTLDKDGNASNINDIPFDFKVLIDRGSL